MNLDADVIGYIVGFLDVPTMLRFAATCSVIYKIVKARVVDFGLFRLSYLCYQCLRCRLDVADRYCIDCMRLHLCITCGKVEDDQGKMQSILNMDGGRDMVVCKSHNTKCSKCDMSMEQLDFFRNRIMCSFCTMIYKMHHNLF